MSYAQAMRWRNKHPKGTRQPVIMSTGSGFWPSKSWIDDCFRPYCEACAAIGIEPMEAEKFYRATLGRQHIQRTPEGYAAMTKGGTL